MIKRAIVVAIIGVVAISWAAAEEWATVTGGVIGGVGNYDLDADGVPLSLGPSRTLGLTLNYTNTTPLSENLIFGLEFGVQGHEGTDEGDFVSLWTTNFLARIGAGYSITSWAHTYGAAVAGPNFTSPEIADTVGGFGYTLRFVGGIAFTIDFGVDMGLGVELESFYEMSRSNFTGTFTDYSGSFRNTGMQIRAGLGLNRAILERLAEE